jgi:hypothetical protein
MVDRYCESLYNIDWIVEGSSKRARMNENEYRTHRFRKTSIFSPLYKLLQCVYVYSMAWHVSQLLVQPQLLSSKNIYELSIIENFTQISALCCSNKICLKCCFFTLQPTKCDDPPHMKPNYTKQMSKFSSVQAEKLNRKKTWDWLDWILQNTKCEKLWKFIFILL